MASNLYDVKDRSGKTIIENVTFGEVVEHLKCSKAQVNNSKPLVIASLENTQ